MTREMVTWAIGWPSDLRGYDVMREADWTYAVTDPMGHYWVGFRQDRVKGFGQYFPKLP